ncbi:MAG: glycosyltransferase [Planctomycetes bacterium]|nr:glycosyltransferase [Planctomycetota bacterium]
MQPAFEEGRRPTWRDRFVPSVRTTCALATQVLPVSRSVRQELISLGVPAEKARVFRNAADRPDLSVYDRNEARRRLGVVGDEPTVVAVGHAVPVKGWDVLIEAMAAVARAVPAARLVLIGSCTQQHEAPEYRRLTALIETHGLANRVRFAGYVPDVYSALVGADVFVLPSRSEGDSNALLQALNCGLPCVATRVGSAEDLIQEGVDGLLVKRDDVEGLAAALRRTLEDAAFRARLALRAASRKHAPTTREYAEKLVDLYAELLRNEGIESTISKPDAPTLNSRGAA